MKKMKNKVHVVLHRRVESGCEDTFEVMKVFAVKDKAEEYADQLSEQIDHEENDDYGVEEEYWVESHNVIEAAK